MAYVRENLIRRKLEAGKAVFGMEIWLRDPRVAELLGQAGFDFFHLEYEHVGHDWTGVEDLIRAAEYMQLTPLFRSEQCIDDVPPANQIIKALKCGAQVIMVPHVESAEAARRAVRAVKYPPLGYRGIATCDRSALEIPGADAGPLDIKSYVTEANSQTMVWAIIESPRALENLDEILAVDGLDAVGFGHQDYAVAAGFDNDSGPKIDAVREKILEASKRAGKYMWWNARTPEEVAEQMERGLRIFIMTVDVIHLSNLMRDMIKRATALVRP